MKAIQNPVYAAVISLIFAVFGIFGISITAYRADFSSDSIALIFPPRFSQTESINEVLRLQGTPIRFGATDNIIIAQFAKDNTYRAYKNSSALFALSPSTPGLCTPSS